MNKFITLTLIAVIFAFTSCQKNDSIDPDAENEYRTEIGVKLFHMVGSPYLELTSEDTNLEVTGGWFQFTAIPSTGTPAQRIYFSRTQPYGEPWQYISRNNEIIPESLHPCPSQVGHRTFDQTVWKFYLEFNDGSHTLYSVTPTTGCEYTEVVKIKK